MITKKKSWVKLTYYDDDKLIVKWQNHTLHNMRVVSKSQDDHLHASWFTVIITGEWLIRQSK